MIKYLIETDFLFGLRTSDRYNPIVERSLKLAREKKVDLAVITSAIFEVRAVLYSQGKKPAEISRILILMKNKLEENDIHEELIQFDDFILADFLRSTYPELTFFDALHAAMSKRRNIPLYGNDAVLKNLLFISKIFGDELI